MSMAGKATAVNSASVEAPARALAADPAAVELFSYGQGRARAAEEISHQVALFGGGLDDAFQQRLGLLGRIPGDLRLGVEHGDPPDIIHYPGPPFDHLHLAVVPAHVDLLALLLSHSRYLDGLFPRLLLRREVVAVEGVEQKGIRRAGEQALARIGDLVGVVPVDLVAKRLGSHDFRQHQAKVGRHVGIDMDVEAAAGGKQLLYQSEPRGEHGKIGA